MAKKRRNRSPRPHRIESVARAGRGRALEVDGFVQSVSVDLIPGPSPAERGEHCPDGASVAEQRDESPGYWELMLPERCPRRALIVGLGGGTVAALLAHACPGVAMVGIECDETVLALARSEFGLDQIPSLQIVVADAFTEIPARAAREPGSYDFICLDLYAGGRLVPGTLATAFLRQLAELLSPGGTISVNLFVSGRLDEQVHRLRRVFAIERQRRTSGNLVVHARRPPEGDQPG